MSKQEQGADFQHGLGDNPEKENGLAECEKGFVDVHLYTNVSVDAMRLTGGKGK